MPSQQLVSSHQFGLKQAMPGDTHAQHLSTSPHALPVLNDYYTWLDLRATVKRSRERRVGPP
jgi:hypothetical protein